MMIMKEVEYVYMTVIIMLFIIAKLGVGETFIDMHGVCCSYSLKCLYCEKIFKDGATLKEHMRKKRHKRLRSSNPDYRRFYVASYLVCI